MKVCYKIWIENKKGKIFGEGPFDILTRVNRTGSLRQSAFEIKMSYSQAWNLIRNLEKKLGYKLLKRKIGGERGGGSELTEKAVILMNKYRTLYIQAEKQINTIYEEIFENK